MSAVQHYHSACDPHLLVAQAVALKQVGLVQGTAHRGQTHSNYIRRSHASPICSVAAAALHMVGSPLESPIHCSLEGGRQLMLADLYSHPVFCRLRTCYCLRKVLNCCDGRP